MVYTSPLEIRRIMDELGLKRARGERVVVGFQGVPPAGLLAEAAELGHEIIDLDEPRPGAGRLEGENFVPQVYCAIIKTIMANVASRSDWSLLLLATGIDKCDGGRFVAHLAAGIAGCPVISAENLEPVRRGNPISVSDLPLYDKFQLITRSLVAPLSRERRIEIERRSCQPVAGFWGVPPYDYNLLKLFPDRTHVYGWTRCIENRTPADLDLEMQVDPGVPAIFYAQSFCQKNSLAFHLAKKYNGLYVEVDGKMTGSTRAKIEAYLQLNAGFKRGTC